MNSLYYGDNLDILRRYVEDESSIGLPRPAVPEQSRLQCPFRRAGRHARPRRSRPSKILGDGIWRRHALSGDRRIRRQMCLAMQAFRQFLGESDMLAYLAMMAPRLSELHRVLKDTGSIYLHCDPTASHYLKLLMDASFGPTQFSNEIVWKRTHSPGVNPSGLVQFTIASCSTPRQILASGRTFAAHTILTTSANTSPIWTQDHHDSFNQLH